MSIIYILLGFRGKYKDINANGKVGNRTKSLLLLYTSETKLKFCKFS